MKCQTFGAFFLAFALPTLAANLEQPAAEIAEAPEAAAVQEQSQELERRIAPLIPIVGSLLGGLFAGRGKGKRDVDEADIAELAAALSAGAEGEDHAALQRRIAPLIPIATTLLGGLFASRGKGKRDLDGSNDAEAVLAELAEAIERESHLDRRALTRTRVGWLAPDMVRPMPWMTSVNRHGRRSLDMAEGDADAHLERRILPFVSLFKKLMGKRDLESSDADTDAALAELADMFAAADEAEAEAGSDAALERRGLIGSFLRKVVGKLGGQLKRDLESSDADTDAALAELADMMAAADEADAEAGSDAALERRRLRLPGILNIIPSILPFGGQKVRRDLDTAEADAHLERRILPFMMLKKFLGARDLEGSDADTDAALAELADMMAAADEADAEAGSDAALERRRLRLPGILGIIPSILPFGGQKVRRDLDMAEADAHLERRILPFVSLFKKLMGKRDLEGSDADTEAAVAELAAALSAGAEGEDHAALQRRIAPLIPIVGSLLGGLFAGRGKGKRDVAEADIAELAAALSAGAEGEDHAALQRRIAPLIPIVGSLLGGLFAGRGKGKRDVDEADIDAALAELASLAEADPSLAARDVAADQTTSSHLSSADLADVMAPVLEQVAAAEAGTETEKRDETIARMRVARGIVVV